MTEEAKNPDETSGSESLAADGSIFEVDDRGNVVDFYAKQDDGTWEKAARLDREAGPHANGYKWDCWGDSEVEDWAYQNGYDNEIAKGKQEK